jgi:hypothetical protein
MKLPSAALVFLFLLNACSSANLLVAANSSWQSPLYVEHALTGKIWDARADAFINQAQLLAVLPGVARGNSRREA